MLHAQSSTVDIDAESDDEGAPAAMNGVEQDGEWHHDAEVALLELLKLLCRRLDDMLGDRAACHAEALGGVGDGLVVATAGEATQALRQQLLGECAAPLHLLVRAKLYLALGAMEPRMPHAELTIADEDAAGLRAALGDPRIPRLV